MIRLIKPFSILFFLVVLFSCQENISIEEESVDLKESFKVSEDNIEIPKARLKVPMDAMSNHFDLKPINAVEPSECDYNSPFDQVIFKSIVSNIDALGAQWYELYADMNFYGSFLPQDEPYFGDKGQYTNYVNNRVRSLEKFWNMPGEVEVRGQHNSTLNDKQKIIDILNFAFIIDPPFTAEILADYFVDVVNVQSTFLVETPLISFDGFAIALGGFLGIEDLIVIGDGLVELASEAGVEDKIVWSGILAHEWAHQIQFNNRGVWYPSGAITRTTELEADYFTSYYLTHKRGGTYNWKRVEDFLELSYNVGDCSFDNPGHHGTHLQRMRAAQMGYELAQSAQKNGKIMNEDEVHEYFLASLDDILEGSE